jgi:S-adenosylmethionine synthetase
MAYRRLFTSESVTEGHPDKIADQISDAVLDAILEQDPMGRVAVEAFVITGQVHIAGEISTSCYVDIPKIVRNVIRDIGYTDSAYGFDAGTCGISVSVDEQSPDIAQGVDQSLEQKESATKAGAAEALGAGDQGMMFGFACRESKELMPLPIVLAHRITKTLAAVRKNEIVDFLRPDGKAQVTVEYDGHKPVRADTIVVSTQHADGYDIGMMRDNIVQHVIKPAFDGDLVIDDNTKLYINPTGRFVIGGPLGDAGLTGRKIIADTYGGMSRHGGGSFSGKDPTKVDRSAAYAARHVAKNVVAAGLSDRCEIQVAYAIGVAHPVSVFVECFGTNRIEESRIAKLITAHFDLRPGAIIERFALRRPIYRQTSTYGHFGRPDLNLPWEKTDVAAALRDAAGIKQSDESFPRTVLSP